MLRATLGSSPEDTATMRTQHEHQREFHLVLIDMCQNSLLTIAARPIYSALYAHVGLADLDDKVAVRVCAEHELLIDAIERKCPDEAERLMETHLAWLDDIYRSIWHPIEAG